MIPPRQVSEIAVTSDYGVADLRAELKELYRKAGVKPALPLVFMLTDSQVLHAGTRVTLEACYG